MPYRIRFITEILFKGVETTFPVNVYEEGTVGDIRDAIILEKKMFIRLKRVPAEIEVYREMDVEQGICAIEMALTKNKAQVQEQLDGVENKIQERIRGIENKIQDLVNIIESKSLDRKVDEEL
ncbi:hypothetical protein RhiirA1_541689 [Rhizophagus irregularis]|uniref:Uncharacterized protein n=4 Tax=Rhizophagus irregularis TaxID=588596 RepID=A0A2N0R1T7_9GLOM|nr:hypothetical protein RhiirA1_541689 [Rhizophagus irregularis]